MAAKSGLHLPADWSDLVKVSTYEVFDSGGLRFYGNFIFILHSVRCRDGTETNLFFFFLSSLTTCFNIHASFPFFFFFFEFFVHVSVSFKTGKRFKFLGFNSGTKT